MEKLGLIKKYLIDNNIFKNENFDRNVSRKSYWYNRFPELTESLFEYYEECKKQFIDNLIFSDFLKLFILNIEIKNIYHKKYNNIKECILKENIGSLQHSYKNYILKNYKNYLNFETDNIKEIIYCIGNNIKDRPKCYHCNKEVQLITSKQGYRKFCSFDCQINFNNLKKEPKFSNLSENEIRNKISKIPLDNRNLTNPQIAEVFLNILDYSKKIENLSDSERIFIFMNEINLSDIYCTCGDKKIFNSQGTGFRKTCGKYGCIRKYQSNNFNCIDDSIFNYKFGCNQNKNIKEAFIYIFYSKSLKIYKIGIAKNVFRRLNKLKNYIEDLELIFSIYKKNTCYIESHFHKKYENNKFIFDTSFDGSTEFFTFNSIELNNIIEEMFRIEL